MHIYLFLIFVSRCLLWPPMTFSFLYRVSNSIHFYIAALPVMTSGNSMSFFFFVFFVCLSGGFSFWWYFLYQILFIFVSQRCQLWPPAIPCLGILKAISSWQKWCSTETSWIGIHKTMCKNNISHLHFSGRLLSCFRIRTTK